MLYNKQPITLIFSIFAILSKGGAISVTRDDLYPWAGVLFGRKKRDMHMLRAAFSRGCPWKSSILPNGVTYKSFANVAASETALWQWHWNQSILDSLTGRAQATNQHLYICPLAVWRALEIRCYNLLLVAAKSVTDERSWHVAWHGIKCAIRIIESMDNHFQCHDCTEDMRQSMHSAAMHDGWQVHANWLTRAVAEGIKKFEEEPQDKVFNWEGNITSTEHFNLMRDGKALLEHARQAKVLRSWVISHSTLITLMRYGQNHRRRLPSGHCESDGHVDMVMMVFTDNWAAFVEALSQAALNFGFECGGIPGWTDQTMFCRQGQGEIEINNADKSYHLDLSANPPSQCLVDHPSAQTWPKLDDPNPERLKLPCPRDPMAFMNHVWAHRYHYMSCFALPISRHDAAIPLTKEDVDSLWNRSLELQGSGFTNMALYFQHCKDHPLSDYAQDLYWGRA